MKVIFENRDKTNIETLIPEDIGEREYYNNLKKRKIW